MTLEELTEEYRQRVAWLVNEIEKGSSAKCEWEKLRDREKDSLKKSRRLAVLSQQHNIEVIGIRTKILAGELFDRLQALNGDTLESVIRRVQDPLLEEAVRGLALLGGKEHTPRDTFIEYYSNRLPKWNQQIPTLIRPVVLLEVLIKNPMAVSRLNDSSSYFPHRLFLREKPPTVKEVDIEIAKLLPSLYSEHLIEIIPRIEAYLRKEQPGDTAKTRCGKYVLPSRLRLIYSQPSSETEEAFDSVYNKQDTKRVIYETLAQCLLTTVNEMVQLRDSIRPLRERTSQFSLGKTEYVSARYMLRNYAVNQLLLVWRDSGGEYVPSFTFLSRFDGIKAENNRTNLVITGKYIDKLTLTPDSRFLNSTMYLPVCVNILHKFYTTAVQLRGTEDA